MVRAVVTLDPEGRAWLDRKSAEEGVPVSQIVRCAVRRLREELEARSGFDALLQQTRGIWTAGDGPDHRKGLRARWSSRG